MTSKRVAWVVSHPIQYRAPVFRALAAMPDIDFKALFLSGHGMKPAVDPGFGVEFEWDVDLLSGYEWSLVEGHRSRTPDRFFSVYASGIHRELQSGYDTVVVEGYGFAGYIEAIRSTRRTGARLVYLSESTQEEKHRSWLKQSAKQLLFRWLVRPGDHGLAVGSRSRRYLKQMGVVSEQIHDYPYCVDTSLTDLAWPRHEQLRAERRAELGISADAVVFVFTGKVFEKKDPLGFLDAFSRVSGPAEVLMVGAGEQANQVEELAERDPRIHYLGFRNQTELPSFYAASDVLVLPSRYAESWGLVVNEAMAMGCAAIVSDRVGSSADLIEGRDTGLVVPANDPEALTVALQQCVDERERLSLWQRNARSIIATHTPEQAAQGVREAAWAP
ncbi:glycosyltransferase family 4 protein [Myxococcota bacterium]|nr:glycosyltransferase family 4 protein [Myxococcota bacterium]